MKLTKIFEDLNYEFSDTTGPEDDKYEIGMMDESIDFSDLKFNNGSLNKIGPNTIFFNENPIVDFGIAEIGNVEVNNKTIPNSIYLKGGYNASKEKMGYGTLGLQFIFHKLPKIDNLILQCLDTAKPFWDNMGGKVIYSKEWGNSGKELYTMIITRKNFINEKQY